MLVLSRKVGERIRIGNSVTVTVVRVTGGGVRLGIEAPPEMPVVREELFEQMEARDREARGEAELPDAPSGPLE
ncbi:MAG: carbon storage regulator [Planctomycetota bacterium]